jgi:hemerythrin superfamily protein
VSDTDSNDVVDILTTDHHEVLELVQRIPSVEDSNVRRELAETVIAELMRHSVAEEMYVYPVMREQLPNGAEEVQHDIDEHQKLEEVMKELERVDANDAGLFDVVARLEEVLRAHAGEEENDQFPQLRAAISHDQLVEIGRKVEAAKKAAPTRPHPASPHSELFHKALGPGVGLVDRLRNKLSGRPTSA